MSLMFLHPTQNVDKWSFDVFALNEASGDHALKFIFYELLTRYDLISRFKVMEMRKLHLLNQIVMLYFNKYLK